MSCSDMREAADTYLETSNGVYAEKLAQYDIESLVESESPVSRPLRGPSGEFSECEAPPSSRVVAPTGTAMC